MKELLVLLLFTIGFSVNGQIEKDSLMKVDSEYLGIAADLYIDTFFVTEQRFSVDDLVKKVVEDSSFYESFKTLRRTSYDFNYDIEYYNKKGKIKAARYSKNKQIVKNNCRSMEIVQDSVYGKYYKKKKYRYYTSSLFKNVFLTEGTQCFSNQSSVSAPSNQSALQYHISMLKKVIFMPGIDSDLPLVGKKMAIFSDEMKDLYNYSITKKTYKNDIECYVFGVSLKDKYQKKNRKAIVRELITYFDQNTMNIVARSYKLRFKNLMYEFDIDIEVELQPFKDKFIPSSVKYDGLWDIAFKKAEKAKFNVELSNFK